MHVSLDSENQNAQDNASGGNNSEQSAIESKKSASHEDGNESDSDTDEQDSDSDSDATDSESDSTDESEAKGTKKKNGFQKRVNKLTARASLAEQERDYWREQALKGQGKQPEPKEAQATEQKPMGEPNPDDFETNAAYIKACVKWEKEQDRLAEKAEADKKAKVESDKKRAQSFQSKVSEFEKTHTDFADVLESCEVAASPDLQELILDSDLAPNLMYHLASKPEEIERLNGLSGAKLAKALGVIEARLETQSDPEKKEIKTSKAPAPISPVGSKGNAVIAKALHDPTISFAEYERQRLKEMKAKQQ